VEVADEEWESGEVEWEFRRRNRALETLQYREWDAYKERGSWGLWWPSWVTGGLRSICGAKNERLRTIIM